MRYECAGVYFSALTFDSLFGMICPFSSSGGRRSWFRPRMASNSICKKQRKKNEVKDGVGAKRGTTNGLAFRGTKANKHAKKNPTQNKALLSVESFSAHFILNICRYI